jgi:hypothetical protein
MRTEVAPSCAVSIFIAGGYGQALETCRSFCDEIGYCVTVTPTTYVYRDGEEEGVVVGLINYPRFPDHPARIEDTAIRLGMRLKKALGQESFSVQTPTTTTWFSWRAADLAIATGSRRAKTPKAVECEANQSGGAAASPNPNPDPGPPGVRS